MSSGRSSLTIEVYPSKWYYLIELHDREEDAWDWMEGEYVGTYGPFDTCDLADEHQADNHQNTGGGEHREYDPKYVDNKTLMARIAEAHPATARGPKRGGF